MTSKWWKSSYVPTRRSISASLMRARRWRWVPPRRVVLSCRAGDGFAQLARGRTSGVAVCGDRSARGPMAIAVPEACRVSTARRWRGPAAAFAWAAEWRECALGTCGCLESFGPVIEPAGSGDGFDEDFMETHAAVRVQWVWAASVALGGRLHGSCGCLDARGAVLAADLPVEYLWPGRGGMLTPAHYGSVVGSYSDQLADPGLALESTVRCGANTASPDGA